MKKKWIFVVVLVAMVLIAGIVVFATTEKQESQKATAVPPPAPPIVETSSQTPPPVTTPTPPSPSEPEISQPGEAIKMTAGDLYDEFKKDAPAADKKYKGRVLEITGRILSMDSDELWVRLTRLGDSRGITCRFKSIKDFPPSMTKEVTIGGTYGTYRYVGTVEVNLYDCLVIR